MAKKKRRKPKQTPINPTTVPNWVRNLQPSSDLSPEDRGRAVNRLKDLLTALSQPPEGVLAMLDRLEIPYTVGELKEFSEGQLLIIEMEDIKEGEKRNESMLKRIYKDNTRIVPRTDIEVSEVQNKTIVEVKE